MGEPSPTASPSVRSHQSLTERRSLGSQSPKIPRHVKSSPSAVSKRSEPATETPLTLNTQRSSPVRKQSPEITQASSGQRSPSVKASASPPQQNNSSSAKVSTPSRILSSTSSGKESGKGRILSPERSTGSPKPTYQVSARASALNGVLANQQRSISNSSRLSTSVRTPASLRGKSSANSRTLSPENARISPRQSQSANQPVRVPSPDRKSTSPSTPNRTSHGPLEQRKSIEVRVPTLDSPKISFSSNARVSTPDRELNRSSGEKNSANTKSLTPDKSPNRHSSSIRTPDRVSAERKSSIMNQQVPESRSILKEVVNLEPQGKTVSDHMDELNETVKKLSESMESQKPGSNIEKIANMSQILTKEANALRESIKSLSEDIAQTKQDLGLKSNVYDEDLKKIPEHPHHLFLLELIVNRIQMKCECFEMDAKNLVITAKFLEKAPVVLYDSSCGSIDDFNKLNVGKSVLFAMTYERICKVKRFHVFVDISKQPPCSHCVTKIGETILDFTKEFAELRDGLCKRWEQERPRDDIMCTASTPMMRNQYYLSCGESHLENPEAIGLIEMSVRMSFLGKEITTAFSPKKQGASVLLKQNNGITMYSCQKVEMDDAGKVLLDEDLMKPREEPSQKGYIPASRSESPMSHSSISRYLSTKRYVEPTIPVGPRQGKPHLNKISIYIPSLLAIVLC